MARTSVKALAAKATRDDAKLRKTLEDAGSPQLGAVTHDSFVNFAHKMGIGADNALSSAGYGFNPISRNRILLEWIHRGSWIGGLVVDVIADDMTRRGAEFATEVPPEDGEVIERTVGAYNIWGQFNETIKWGRLYGGAIAVALLDGQDFREPLRIHTTGPGQFKGMLVLDRWMVEPSLEDLVTDLGPYLGLPKYYRVTAAAPALRGQVIHYSRVMCRHSGVELPYQQRLQEMLWGTSVLERLYDRMVAFDSASTGAAQLVYKSYLRTLSIDGLRDLIAAGGKALDGLTAYVDMMRRFQGIEGVTLIDVKDKYEQQTHGAFSGLSDALVQFGQQLSGAAQIPLVRLFGQSPAGLSSTGESDLTTYYDHIKRLQQKDLHHGVTMAYQLVAMSRGIKLPDNFAVEFKPLRELDDAAKSTIAQENGNTVTGAYEAGLISQQTALKELRQASKRTGVFTNITREDIAVADMTVEPPAPEGMGPGIGPDGQPLPNPLGGGAPGQDAPVPGLPRTPLNNDEDQNDGQQEVRPQGTPPQVGQGPRRRVQLQQ